MNIVNSPMFGSGFPASKRYVVGEALAVERVLVPLVEIALGISR